MTPTSNRSLRTFKVVMTANGRQHHFDVMACSDDEVMEFIIENGPKAGLVQSIIG